MLLNKFIETIKILQILKMIFKMLQKNLMQMIVYSAKLHHKCTQVQIKLKSQLILPPLNTAFQISNNLCLGTRISADYQTEVKKITNPCPQLFNKQSNISNVLILNSYVELKPNPDIFKMISPTNNDPSFDEANSTMGQPREFKVELMNNKRHEFEVIGYSK